MRLSYPKHLSDPIRREIAAEAVSKELHRSLPDVFGQLDPPLASRIYDWFEATNLKLIPTHDFWNLVEGIMGAARLKTNLIKLLSAENTVWSLESVDLDKVIFNWPIAELESFGKLPLSGAAVRSQLETDAELRHKLKKVISHDPSPWRAVLFEEQEQLVIQNGSYTCLRLLVYDQTPGGMWVGRFNKGSSPTNYWVSSSLLNNLAQQARMADNSGDKKAVTAIKTTLLSFFRASGIAKLNYEHLVAPRAEFNRQLVS